MVYINAIGIFHLVQEWKLHQCNVNTHLEFNNCIQEFYSCRQIYVNQFLKCWKAEAGSPEFPIPVPLTFSVPPNLGVSHLFVLFLLQTILWYSFLFFSLLTFPRVPPPSPPYQSPSLLPYAIYSGHILNKCTVLEIQNRVDSCYVNAFNHVTTGVDGRAKVTCWATERKRTWTSV